MPVKFTFASPMMKSWLLIHQSHRLLERNENAILSKFGLTVQKHAVLFALKTLPGPLKVIDVAKWLDRNPNGISMLVDRMEKDGLLSRTLDNTDRRATRLEMTLKGEDLYDQSTELLTQLQKDIFHHLSKEELEMLSTILAKVQRAGLHILDPSRTINELQVLDE